MIEVDQVSKSYGEIQALREVSFRVARGEIVGLLGPNAAGKTTLLKTLTGYFEPSEGQVRIAGIDVTEDPIAAQRLVGYLPENAPLYPELLVQESLCMTADLRGLGPPGRDRHLAAAIEATGIAGVLTRPIGKLSKGFRQRVGLAQALMHRPDILILDEPTSGLDPGQIVEVRSLIRALGSQTTVILSTHILSEVEQTCERVLLLLNGRLHLDARLDELTATRRYRLVLKEGVAPAAVREKLAAAAGVQSVEVEQDASAGRTVVLVEGEAGADLGALLYDQARAADWPLRELHPQTRTLESVYRSISSGKEVAL